MNWLKYAIDYGVMGLLALMSVIALGIALERWRTLAKIKVADFPNKQTMELHITGKLHLIATIGSNAPYIGLLGHRARNHADVLHHGGTRVHGFRENHDGPGPGA